MITRSVRIVVVYDDDLLSSSSRSHVLAPVLDALRGAADVSPAEAVVSPSIEGADMAALGIDVGQIDRFAEPVRADTVGVVITSAGNSKAVKPPAIEAQKLAHYSLAKDSQ
jgi:hypothetical protein